VAGLRARANRANCADLAHAFLPSFLPGPKAMANSQLGLLEAALRSAHGALRERSRYGIRPSPRTRMRPSAPRLHRS
jgi:hypothetical protein